MLTQSLLPKKLFFNHKGHKETRRETHKDYFYMGRFILELIGHLLDLLYFQLFVKIIKNLENIS